MIVTYVGVKRESEWVVRRVEHRDDLVVRGENLPDRRDLIDLSPTFDWGGETAGASQLALAILADHLGDQDDEAVRWYPQYVDRVIAHLPDVTWELPAEDVEATVREMRG